VGGLYNMVFGTPPPEVVASLLSLAGQPALPARYRDIWLERDDEHGLVIAIYTRLGGGNRPDYADEWARLRALPTYVRDADDKWDTTYATIRFKPDPEVWSGMGEDSRAQLIALADPTPRDQDARWKRAIDAIGKHAQQ
jgi:hypothetical protein